MDGPERRMMPVDVRLRRMLALAWSAESSTKWTRDAPATGQCVPTALVVQDLCGGRLLRTRVGPTWHFYNQVGGQRHDLTALQFATPPDYEDIEASRADAEAACTPSQYQALRNRVAASCIDGSRHTPHDDARVIVAAYDVGWPAAFENERRALEPVLAPWLAGAIEHVGSTAVPGLTAKPVIDIMVPVTALDAARPAIAALVTFGYCHAPYRADVMHWFCKPSPGWRTHHLHLVPLHSRLWSDRILFRDLLRNDTELAAGYATLKRALASAHPTDRDAYTVGKTRFIERALAVRRGQSG